MKIIKTNKLDINLINKLSEIVSSCNRYDGVEHPSYLENEPPFFPAFNNYFIAMEDENPVSFISFFTSDGYCARCYAFTLPTYRKKGYFNVLLSKAWDEILSFEYETVVFPVLPKNHTAIEIIKKFNGYKYCSECILKYDNSTTLQNDSLNNKLSISCKKSDLLFSYTLFLDNFFKKRTIGKCNVEVFENSVFIYDLEINKSKRGRGFGNAFVKMIVSDLKSRGYADIMLQVSTNNVAAYNMYLHNNFVVYSELEIWNIDNKKSNNYIS